MDIIQAFRNQYRKPQPLPPLLQLPVELLLEICDRIGAGSPESTAALAVSCKTLFSVLSSNNRIPRLRGKHLTTFLSRLERDLGDYLYLCPYCSRLHHFHSYWGPLSIDLFTGCRSRQPHSAYPYQLGWHHLHLVMNRHRLGDTKGLPLQNLEGHTSSSGVNLDRRWQHEWTAKIMNNELFLRARHTLSGHDKHELHRAVGHETLSICHHIRMHSGATTRPALSFVARRGGLGACRSCLTDYTTKIEGHDATSSWWQVIQEGMGQGGNYWTSGGRGRRRDARRWSITITAYHQVGDGVSPGDWKWMAFAGRSVEPRFRTWKYPPGSVIERWLEAQGIRDLSIPKPML
ncbi:hypothetical protein VMCG_09329 [Cytospora schulzeri]|uniref:F-box domain-containing protein n=1 Tax=Cytospora schulzeri TaxID=448051 RepID=A0A423VJJ9_9PEZI|nr:hypothetical protein VMCG_09329 [Valsa malicola]